MAWPDSYDDWTAPSGSSTRTGANALTTRVEQIYTAIETLQHTLGLNPEGAFATLVERIEALETALADGLDDVNAGVTNTLNGLQDSEDPFPNSAYPLLRRQTTGHSREIFVTNTASSTGEDGAVHIDLDG